ncbi:MAG: outer membrane beta-barrel protein [Bacteroidota bacterium]|nr:outer membrane beta-barrel protein [Bacteroidota bacterium]
MSRLLFLLMGLFIFFTKVQGQKLQLGIGANINGTIFQKGKSTYDNYFFETKTKAGFGLSIPCYIKVNNHWTIRTGVGFQNKKYHFEQNRFDFPNVTEGSGSFYMQIKFTSLEVPLIFCFSPANKDKKFKIEYKLGCVLTYNAPKVMTVGVEEFKYNGTDTCNYQFSINTQSWSKYFSPDIYAGISLIKTKESIRRHELTLSYQHSFTPSTKFDFSSSLWTSSLKKNYQATLRPTLSYFALTYTFYPKWLNIIKDKDGMTN